MNEGINAHEAHPLKMSGGSGDSSVDHGVFVKKIEELASVVSQRMASFQADVTRRLADQGDRLVRLERLMDRPNGQDAQVDLSRLDNKLGEVQGNISAFFLNGSSELFDKSKRIEASFSYLTERLHGLNSKLAAIEQGFSNDEKSLAAITVKLAKGKVKPHLEPGPPPFVNPQVKEEPPKVHDIPPPKSDPPHYTPPPDFGFRSEESKYPDFKGPFEIKTDPDRPESNENVLVRCTGGYKEWYVFNTKKKDLTSFSSMSDINLTGISLGNSYLENKSVFVLDIEIRRGESARSPVVYRHPVTVKLTWNGSTETRFIKVKFDSLVSIEAFTMYTIRIGYLGPCSCWGSNEQSEIECDGNYFQFGRTDSGSDEDNGDGLLAGPIKSIYFKPI
mmetsp:Transcript_19186/g.35046  ORF Transcript_19186/g.35046 Transcript_19186/m.35046 type:complete len:390 (-) Transcript_19186:1140-2309(-)